MWWILPLMQTPEGGKRLFWGHVEVEKVNGVLPVGALSLAHTELRIAWEIRPMDALTVPFEMDISYLSSIFWKGREHSWILTDVLFQEETHICQTIQRKQNSLKHFEYYTMIVHHSILNWKCLLNHKCNFLNLTLIWSE